MSRTSPNQAIVSRPARGKYSLQSRRSDYSSNKAPVSYPRYVTRLFPDADIATRRAMVNAIERYMESPAGKLHGVPSPAQCKLLFDGLI